MNDFGGYEEPTSRAFWGLEDLEEDAPTIPKFSLEWVKDSPSSIEMLVIIAGDIVTAVAEKHIVHNAERLCTINSTAEFNVAAVFKLNNDVCVCIVKSSVDMTLAGEFIQAISEITLKAKKIIAFTNANMSQLQGTERNVGIPTLWGCLYTGRGRELRIDEVTDLRHPNFIAGVAAGVVGYADMMEVPAIVYVMYVSDDAYDTETVEPMITLFSKVTKYIVPKLDSNSKTFNTTKLKLYI